MSKQTLRERAELSDLHYQMRQDMQDDRDRLAKQLAIAVEALELSCGDRCNREYNPCWERDTLNKIKEVE